MSISFLTLFHNPSIQPIVHNPDSRPIIYIAIVAKKDGSVRTRCLNPNAIGTQAHARGRKRAFSHNSNNIPLSRAKLLMFWHKRSDEPISLLTLLPPPKKDIASEYLLVLPFEIIHRILTLLDPASVLQLGQTSRSLYALCHSNHVWSSLFHQDFYTLAQSPDFESLYRNRKELNRRWKEGHADVYYLDDTDGHRDSIYSLAWLDHRTILSASRDQTMKIWDLLTRRCIATHVPSSGHQGSILCVAAAPEGRYAVTGSSGGSCVTWSMQQKKAFKQLQHYRNHHSQSVLSAAFVNNEELVTASKDTTLHIWNVLTGATCHILRGHTEAVNAVKTFDNGRRIVSGSGDGTVRIWCTETGRCLQILESQVGWISCLQVAVKGPDRTIWAGGLRNNQIQVWTLGDKVRTMTTPSGHIGTMRSLDATEDRVVTVGYDKVIKVWDTRTGKCTVNFQSGHTARIFSVLLGSTAVVSAGQDRRIMVLDFGHGLSLDQAEC